MIRAGRRLQPIHVRLLGGFTDGSQVWKWRCRQCRAEGRRASAAGAGDSGRAHRSIYHGEK